MGKEWLDNIGAFRFRHLKGSGKWMKNLYVLYIYLLDVEPAAMLHEENKQYTVKRSEPRYNRDILIYSLISSLLRELHDTLSLTPLIIPFFSPTRTHFHFFNFFLHNLYFSFFFLMASAFLSCTTPHLLNPGSHQGSELSCIIIQPWGWAEGWGAKGKTASTK